MSAERVAQHRRQAGRALDLYDTLTRREREVLQLVAEGRSSCEMAASMHISIKTVETHRRNIVQKLGLHGTAQLTKYAIREGLTTVSE
jgi:DNA-binding NarL/FixJ family response regulator